MRPLLAPKRSANSDTLLALGSAASNTITCSANGSSGTPRATALVPASSTKSGCKNSLIQATGTTSDQRTAWLASSRESICERASTAPMVNSATGEAASASKPTVVATGLGSSSASADASAPNKIDQGMGLANTPLSAFLPACATEAPPCAPRRDRAMHSEDVMTMSTKMVTMAGPAARGPKSATSKGTPMKPVLGNAPTSAPKDASFQPMRPWPGRCKVTATTNATMVRAHTR